MILVIDNYDSFTFNLVQYLGELSTDIRVIKNDEITVDEIPLWDPSHIIISPGPGIPEEAGMSIEVVQKLGKAIPILGVCLGYQAIAVAYRGTLKRAPTLFHGKTSMVEHDGRGLFEGVPSPFQAMRYHSWIVDDLSLGSDLNITATTQDRLPMAIQHQSHPVYGVQFHPESILTPSGQGIIKNFLSS